MSRIQLIASGVKLAGDELEQLAQRARNGKPATTVILEQMRQAQVEQFASSGGRGGSPWAPDSEGWKDRKADEGKSSQPLRYTDALYESLTTKGRGSAGVRSATGQKAALGTKIAYAIYQGNKRRLIAFTEADTVTWEDVIVNWLIKGESSGTAS